MPLPTGSSSVHGSPSRVPKPKEKKPLPGILEGSVLVPGAIIAGGLLVAATAIGVFKILGGKNKKDHPKATKLD
ncbi:MAG: hypothetical protein N2691_04445 [Patescibacteria group bacterium]|nr:hypothetical protein [Patescibacteria group bacterium]